MIRSPHLHLTMPMSSSCLLMFPTTLYEHKRPNHDLDVYVIEEPMYFHDQKHRPLRYHKLKIAFMHLCLSEYAKENGYKFIIYDKVTKDFYSSLAKYLNIYIYDPCDIPLVRKYSKLFGAKLKIINDPQMFLITKKQVQEYRGPTIHASFYKYVKDCIKLSDPNLKTSTDKENRHALPKDWKPPPHRPVSLSGSKRTQALKEAQTYVETHPLFSKNTGTLTELDKLAYTHQEAKQVFQDFLSNKFKYYGKYQDAIDTVDSHVYHSNCSYLINMGLLSPRWILTQVQLYAKRHSIPHNSLEGFIRQLVGWREYMRFLYLTQFKYIQPIFKPAATLPQSWYTAGNNTHILPPLENEIKKVQRLGWAHHIVRLMMFLNYFKLAGAKPSAIYKWFMEMIALDAYEWVMYSNICAMGAYGPKRYMHKPYLSASAYIRRMSNYKAGPWCEVWDALFYTYISKGHERVYLRNLSNIDKTKLSKYKEIAKAYQL